MGVYLRRAHSRPGPVARTFSARTTGDLLAHGALPAMLATNLPTCLPAYLS